MKLFIANCTRAGFVFYARIPEVNKAIRLEIPSGQQRSFPFDMSGEQREAVLLQLQRYGGRSRTEIRGKLSKFDGIAYSIDKPISENEILAGNEAQLDHAQNRAVAQATNSALAAELAFRDPKSKKKRSVRSVGVEVYEKTDARSDERPLMNLEISESGSRSERLPV